MTPMKAMVRADIRLTRHCVNCEFWDVAPLTDLTNGAFCRRLPPPASYPASTWPVTHSHDWCGEFRAKEPA